ncbi:MAG: tetratricopeptide repeat protein, partial [Spirirestis rafaelensis WJT71-NPBG6]|nr:tetratricopeptide repeat protein [Spirirestis rafaelensis WJT71-NPBG6]
MNKGVKSRRIFWCLLPSFTRRSLIFLLSAVLLSESVGATPRGSGLQIAQQPVTNSQDAILAAAKQVFIEGMKLYQQGTPESLRQAIEKWKAALPLSQQVNDKAGKFVEAVTLLAIGGAYSDLNDKQQALKYYNLSLPLWRAVNDNANESITLNSIATIYSVLGDKQKALNYYNLALPLSQQLPDKTQQAINLYSIGKVYSDLGDNQKALNYYNLALPLSQKLSNNRAESYIRNNIAGVYSVLGEKQKALDNFKLALLWSQKNDNKLEQAVTLSNIGTIYSGLGDNQQALNYYNEALPLSRQVRDKSQEATTLINIGKVYSDLGDNQQALKYYNEALPLWRQLQDKSGEAITLNNIGRVHDALGDNQQALKDFNQALPLSQQIGDKTQEAIILNNIGTVNDALGNKQQALNYYNQALPLHRQVGDKSGEANTLGNIASVERDRGNLQQALTQIQAAIDIIENLRTKVDSQDLRTSYFATQQKTYKFYIDLLMQLHKQDPSKGYNAEALHASESSRARGLIELLTEARANIRKGVNPKLLEEEKRLQLKIEAIGKQIQELSSKPQTETALINFKKELETLLTQQKELETKIRTNSPKYAALQYPQPLKLPQIQQQLDKDSLLLEYSLGNERSYLWAVTPNSINSYELPKRQEIEKAATEFRKNLQKNATGDLTALSAAKLSKLILAPVADKLGKKRLVIVADGELQKIPFAGLNDVETRQQNVSTNRATKTEVNYQPLIVNHEIVNLPSVTTIASHRLDLKGRKTAPLTLAILADPVFEANDP